MTMAADLDTLWRRLHELRDVVVPLQLLVTEDCPAGVAPRPAQALADALDEVRGLLAEAIDALAAVLAEGAEPRGRAELVRTLGHCHQRLIEFGVRWAAEISSHERLVQLWTAAQERGPRWRTWAATVLDGILGCEGLRGDVHLALLACWQDLAERAAPSQLSPSSSAATKER